MNCQVPFNFVNFEVDHKTVNIKKGTQTFLSPLLVSMLYKSQTLMAVKYNGFTVKCRVIELYRLHGLQTFCNPSVQNKVK